MPKRVQVQDSVDVERAVKKPTKAAAKNKIPKTLKEKILDLLATEETLVSLPTMKKILCERYDCGCADVKQATALNNKINKTLKSLLEENRDDFQKIGGSYHGATYVAQPKNENDDSGGGDSEVSFSRFHV